MLSTTWVLQVVSKQTSLKHSYSPFPKHHIQQLPAYLKYFQYPQKPGKRLPRFDGSAIRWQVLTFTRHERCLPTPSPSAIYSWPALTTTVQVRTAFDANSVIHPRQQQYIVLELTAGLYPTFKYSYNLVQQEWLEATVICKFCYTHYQTCLSTLTSIDKSYHCLPTLSTINCTHSQTCLSMFTFIDTAYQCLPTLSIINGRCLPRYRQLHDTETILRMFPSLSFQVPYQVPYFYQRLHIPPPPFCVPSHKAKREKKKTVPPSLKRDFESACLYLPRSTIFRGWTSYGSGIIVMPCLYLLPFLSKKKGIKKIKNQH